MKIIYLLVSSIILIIVSCAAPSGLVEAYQEMKYHIPSVPDTSNLSYPPLLFEEWFLYTENEAGKLPEVIQSNQMGIGFMQEDVYHYFCMPSATPHVVLSRNIALSDEKLAIGEWFGVGSDVFLVRDSLSAIDSTVHRTIDIQSQNPDEVLLTFDESRLKMYAKSGQNSSFRRVVNKAYTIMDGHYLLLQRSGEAGPTSSTNFIGLDEDGKLYFDNYKVDIYTKENEYQIHEARVMRFVFKRLVSGT